ncbi:hypothetical protein H6P81_004238 [Aristolochia fimbriata]|uniref:Uncharacterized protein n=1 Tax=Aristolochia fimbriata TaxID=158543 RepID=A0AAV7FHA7_ARIFI|nr:hypothetical protein H6P81_004238 [Aristolochia fimbriata]
MEKWRSPLFLLFLLSRLSLVFPFNPPSHGCYWTESCQNKWIGGCGVGHVIVDQSDSCHGLCPESNYPPCIPFHTHFRCCKPETPKVTDRCVKCDNKVDFGDEFICCTDCSEAYITDKNTKLGYCKSGAELAVQLKPQEVFKWIAGPWMKCSSPCDGGIRYRDVTCFGSIEDVPVRQFVVDDSMCSLEEMPARQEACNLISCDELLDGYPNAKKRTGMSPFLVVLLVVLGLVAAGGIGFAGYTYYKRRNSNSSGFVYIMLEGYS